MVFKLIVFYLFITCRLVARDAFEYADEQIPISEDLTSNEEELDNLTQEDNSVLTPTTNTPINTEVKEIEPQEDKQVPPIDEQFEETVDHNNETESKIDFSKKDEVEVEVLGTSKRGNFVLKTLKFTNYIPKEHLVLELSNQTIIEFHVMAIKKDKILGKPVSDQIQVKKGSVGKIYHVKYVKKEIVVNKPSLHSYIPKDHFLTLDLYMGFKTFQFSTAGDDTTDIFSSSSTPTFGMGLELKTTNWLWVGIDFYYEKFVIIKPDNYLTNTDKFSGYSVTGYLKYLPFYMIKNKWVNQINLKIAGEASKKTYYSLDSGTTINYTAHHILTPSVTFQAGYQISLTEVLHIGINGAYLYLKGMADDSITTEDNSGIRYSFYGIYDFESISVFSDNTFTSHTANISLHTQQTDETLFKVGLKKYF